jgi:hypothetical protein
MGNDYARFGGGHLEKGRNVPRQVSTLQRYPNERRHPSGIPRLTACHACHLGRSVADARTETRARASQSVPRSTVLQGMSGHECPSLARGA